MWLESGNTQAPWESFSPSKTCNSSLPSVFVMDNDIGLGESTGQTQPPTSKPVHDLKALSREILGPPWIPGQNDGQTPQPQRDRQNHLRKQHTLPMALGSATLRVGVDNLFTLSHQSCCLGHRKKRPVPGFQSQQVFSQSML